MAKTKTKADLERENRKLRDELKNLLEEYTEMQEKIEMSKGGNATHKFSVPFVNEKIERPSWHFIDVFFNPYTGTSFVDVDSIVEMQGNSLSSDIMMMEGKKTIVQYIDEEKRKF